MDSHAASWALFMCLAFTGGCSSLLKWDRDRELDLAEAPRRSPADIEPLPQAEVRKRPASLDHDPPPAPDGIVDEKPTARIAKPNEFVEQLEGTNNLTAEDMATFERLIEKSPAAAQFLASKGSDPAERNLAKVHAQTDVEPPADGGQGIDLLREGRTMPAPRLDSANPANNPPMAHPDQVRLGAPTPMNTPPAQQPVPPATENRMPPQDNLRSSNEPPYQPPQLAASPTLPGGLPQVQNGNQGHPGGLGPHVYRNPHVAGANPNLPPVQRPGQTPLAHNNPFVDPPAGNHAPQGNGQPTGPIPGDGNSQMIHNPHVPRTDQPQGGVVQASHNGGYQQTATPNAPEGDQTPETEPISWRQHLEHSIAALEAELNQAYIARDSYGKPPKEGEATAAPRRLLPLEKQEIAKLEAQLRILYLSAGMREAAVSPVEYYEPKQQEFYKYAMNGLSVYLDSDQHPVDERRLKLALRDMRQAVSELSTASSLDVRNLAFCSRVDSFGSYEEFPEFQFTAGQEVLLYVEVENFATEKGLDGYETALLGSYRVFDVRKNRVADHTFIEEVEVCRNRRRDYFITYRMWIPKDVAPGQYTLQLTVEDLKGNKSGQSSIRFEVQ